MPVTVIDTIIPQNNGQFPVVEDVNFKGGFQVQPTVAALDAIFTENRKAGMLVYVVGPPAGFYQLASDLVTWTAISFGSFTAGGDLTGSNTDQVIYALQGHVLNAYSPTTGQVLTYNGSEWVPGSASGGISALTGDVIASGSGSVTATVVGLDGKAIVLTSLATGQVLQYNGTDWVNVTPASGFTAGGDLSGSSTSQTVIGIQGHSVSSTTPSANQVLEYVGGVWTPTSLPSSLPPNGAASGDLSGSYPSPTVISVAHITTGVLTVTNGGTGDSSLAAHSLLVGNGTSAIATVGPASTSGQALVSQGASANPAFSALNLGGGSTFVTGTLPTANQASQSLTLTGDVTSSGGTTASASTTVAKIQGNPVSSTLATAGQFLIENAAATGSAWTSISGDADASTSTPGQLTVIGLQGFGISSTTPTNGQALVYNGSQWAPTIAFSAGGDLAGSTTSQNVVALRGNAIRNQGALTTTQDGYILTWYTATGWQALPNSGGGGGGGNFVAGGDLSGSSTDQTVIGIYGIPVTISGLTTGQVLSYNGSEWIPTTVGGGGFTAGGDLSGTNTDQTVIAINGASVPASGSLTTGNVLQVSGSSSLTYGPVNLAGGSHYVTGVLPTGNQAVQSMGGDVTGTTAASTVAKLQGVSVSNTTPTSGQVLEYNGTSWTPMTFSGSFTAGGDLTGTSTNQTVSAIQGMSTPAGSTAVINDTLVATGVLGSISSFYFDSVTNYMWMSQWSNTDVAVIDALTLKLVASIPLNWTVSYGTAYTTRVRGDSNYVYVSSYDYSLEAGSGYGEVAIIDKSTLSLVGLLQVNPPNTIVSSTSNGTQFLSTTIAPASNYVALPTSTITVNDASGFPPSGTIYIQQSLVGNYPTYPPVMVNYTSIVGNTFMGCTGGYGLMATGDTVATVYDVNVGSTVGWPNAGIFYEESLGITFGYTAISGTAFLNAYPMYSGSGTLSTGDTIEIPYGGETTTDLQPDGYGNLFVSVDYGPYLAWYTSTDIANAIAAYPSQYNTPANNPLYLPYGVGPMAWDNDHDVLWAANSSNDFDDYVPAVIYQLSSTNTLQQTAWYLATAVAVGSNGDESTPPTINVLDTTGFPTSGSVQILGSSYDEIVSYTNTSPTTFEGCSGDSATLVTGQWVIYQNAGNFYGFNGMAYYDGYIWTGTEENQVVQFTASAFPSGGTLDVPVNLLAAQVISTDAGETGDIYSDTFTNTLLVQDQSNFPTIIRLNTDGSIASEISYSDFSGGNEPEWIEAIPSSSSLLWIGDKNNTGVWLFTNTVGSESQIELLAPLELTYQSPIIWESNSTNIASSGPLRYFNVTGTGFTFSQETDSNGNLAATLDLIPASASIDVALNAGFVVSADYLQFYGGQGLQIGSQAGLTSLPAQVSVSSGYPYTFPSSNPGAAIPQIAYCQTNTGTTSVTMPYPPYTPYASTFIGVNGSYNGSGYWIRVTDDANAAATYNITVSASGSGDLVEDPNTPGTFSTSVVLSKNSCAVTWEYDGTNGHWKIISSVYGTSSGGITALTGDVTASGSGSVVATVTGIQAVTISGTAPTTGQVLTATSGTAANWQTPSGGSGYATIQQNGTSETARTKLNFLNSVSIADDSSNTSTDVTIVHADNSIARRSFNRHRLRTTGFTGTQFGTNGFVRYAVGVTGSLSSNCWEGTNVGVGTVAFGEYLYFSGSQYENSTYDYPNSTIWGLDTLTGNSLSLSGVPLYVPYAVGNFNSDLGTMAHATVNVNQSPFSGPYDFIFTGNTGTTNGGYVELGYVTPFEGTSAPQTTVASGSNGVSVGTYASSSQSVTSGTINVFDTTGFPGSGSIIAQTLYNGAVTINYTGTSGGTSFTGCTTSGTGTIPQDGQITPGSLVINVASTSGFPSSGTLQVLTSYGLMLVGYTGTSGGNQFTGCYVNGPNSIETMSTGNLVTLSGYTRLFRQLGNGGGIWTGPIKAATSIGFAKARTTLTAGSNGSSLPQSTIYVTNTNGFPFSGSFYLTPGSSGTPQLITYTGKTGTTFTGCSGGTGTMATGNVVTADTPPYFAFIDGSYHVWIVAPDGSASEVISTTAFPTALVYDDNGYLWVASTNSSETTVTLTKYPLSYSSSTSYPGFPVSLGAAAATRTCSNSNFEGVTSNGVYGTVYGIADPAGGGLAFDGKYIWGMAGNADSTGNQTWLFAYDLATAALVKSFGTGYDTPSVTSAGVPTHRIFSDGETIWLAAAGFYGAYDEPKFVKLLNIHPESGEILYNSGVLSNTSTIPQAGSIRDMTVTDGGDVYMTYTSTNTSAGNGNDLGLYRASANANTIHAHSINLDRLPGGLGGLQSGSVTLSSGTATVNTGITINSTSTTRVMLTLTSPSGTLGAHYEVTSLVAGIPGTGSFTVNSVTTSGSTVTTDNSTLNYLIVG